MWSGILCGIRCTWLRSRRWACLVTRFCYHLIAKPGNKTGVPSWPDPHVCKDHAIKTRVFVCVGDISEACTNGLCYKIYFYHITALEYIICVYVRLLLYAFVTMCDADFKFPGFELWLPMSPEALSLRAQSLAPSLCILTYRSAAGGNITACSYITWLTV